MGGIHRAARCLCSSSSYSLNYFLTGVSEPTTGLPKFFAVGFVNDQLTDYYDSNTRRSVPHVCWLEEVEKDYPQFWDRKSQTLLNIELTLGTNLDFLRNSLNQSREELHTLQIMCGCQVEPDGQHIRSHFRFAYDGEDLIAFDEKTHTWVAPVPQVQAIKKMWETAGILAQIGRGYQEECSFWLRRYPEYGKKSLERTEAPTVRMARKIEYDGRETLICRAHGFYPQEIEVTWMKDGKDQKPDTFTRGVVPNSDGTYHTWLSIEVDAQERDHYWCQVEHDGLPEPLILPWEGPAFNLGLLLGSLGGAVALLLVTGVTFCMSK
uniref:Uncharacterized protein n=1 Tax=Sphaerodactylus townsendi TaxID=933632 RepID=A0ACB8EFB5_9SAUR